MLAHSALPNSSLCGAQYSDEHVDALRSYYAHYTELDESTRKLTLEFCEDLSRIRVVAICAGVNTMGVVRLSSIQCSITVLAIRLRY